MEKGLKGVIFDWAGTTIDYGCLAPAIVFVEVFKNRGIVLTIDEAREPMGLAKKDHVRALLENSSVKNQWNTQFGNFPSQSDINEVYADLEPSLALIVAKYSVPIPGTIELVNTLKNRNVKIGTTTGYVASMMKNVIPVAKKLGFDPDCIVNSSDVNEGRPKPWMIYLNAQQLNIYPLSAMIKVGDTVADIEEGRNAGMWTIGVTKSGNEVGYSFDEIQTIDQLIIKQKIEKATSKLYQAGAHFVVDGVWDCLPIIDMIDNLIKQGVKP